MAVNNYWISFSSLEEPQIPANFPWHTWKSLTKYTSSKSDMWQCRIALQTVSEESAIKIVEGAFKNIFCFNFVQVMAEDWCPFTRFFTHETSNNPTYNWTFLKKPVSPMVSYLHTLEEIIDDYNFSDNQTATLVNILKYLKGKMYSPSTVICNDCLNAIHVRE